MFSSGCRRTNPMVCTAATLDRQVIGEKFQSFPTRTTWPVSLRGIGIICFIFVEEISFNIFQQNARFPEKNNSKVIIPTHPIPPRKVSSILNLPLQNILFVYPATQERVQKQRFSTTFSYIFHLPSCRFF